LALLILRNLMKGTSPFLTHLSMKVIRTSYADRSLSVVRQSVRQQLLTNISETTEPNKM